MFAFDSMTTSHLSQAAQVQVCIEAAMAGACLSSHNAMLDSLLPMSHLDCDAQPALVIDIYMMLIHSASFSGSVHSILCS